jgi:hypothetical protein
MKIVYEMKYYASLIFLLILMSACKEHESQTTDTKVISVENQPKCESLLIIAEDRSGSTSDHRKLTQEEYLKLFQTFNSKFSGQIAVRVIGNPAPEEREFYSVSLKSLQLFEKMKNDPTYDERILTNRRNFEIDSINQEVLSENQDKIEKQMMPLVEKHIIGYKPYLKSDKTNIKDPLEHILTKIEEPTFKNYKRIDVLIISDGLDDVNPKNSIISFKTSIPVHLYLVGWQDKKIFEGIHNIETFESFNGFVDYYNKLECNP